MIAGEDEYLLGWMGPDKIQILPDGISGAPVPVGIPEAGAGRQDLYAAGAAGKIPCITCAKVTHE